MEKDQEKEVQIKARYVHLTRLVQQSIDELKQLNINLSQRTKIRHKILELCEDIILINPKFAAKAKVDEILWNNGLYSRIEELRADFRKKKSESASRGLLLELDLADNFFKTLLLLLASLQDGQSDSYQPEVKLISSKCLVYLGDIARYKAVSQRQDVKDWSEAWLWYEKAFDLYPQSGKAHAQLALLSNSKMVNLDVLYYNCLSLGNMEPGVVARSNLTAFTFKYTGQPLYEVSPTSDFSFNVSCIMSLFSYLFQQGVGNVTKEVDLVFSLAPILANMDQTDMIAVTKITTCFLVLLDDLEQSFQNSIQTGFKQNIRNSQVICFALLLSFSKRCIDITIDQLEGSETEGSLLSSGYLVPISYFSLWLGLHKSFIPTYLSYGTVLRPKEFEQLLLDWSASIVKLVNMLSTFADMDAVFAYTPSDLPIQGLKCFVPLFDDRSGAKDAFRNNNTLMTYFSRICSTLEKLAEDEKVIFIEFDEKDGTFLVKDSNTKRKELQRMMKVLATERLKGEVSSLEKALGLEKIDSPMYLLDPELFLTNLGDIKSCLMSRAGTIIVSIDVFQYLDKSKNGADSRSAKARESIRYLDQRFKYPSPYLIGQKPNQIVSPSNPIPGNYLNLIGCYLYFQQSVAEQQRQVYLVTDSADLKQYLIGDISIISVAEWLVKLNK